MFEYPGEGTWEWVGFCVCAVDGWGGCLISMVLKRLFNTDKEVTKNHQRTKGGKRADKH